MIKLYNIDHFRLEDTFLCGQCFRWKKDEDGVFRGVVQNHAVKMYYVDEKTIYVESSNPDLVYWSHYLSFSTDYNTVEDSFKDDENLKKCIEAGRGIRLLHQDLWETLVSFIISANNNIPRIQGIIEKLCQLFGEEIPKWVFLTKSSKATVEQRLAEGMDTADVEIPSLFDVRNSV